MTTRDDKELAALQRRFEQYRARVHRLLTLAETELRDRNHRSCADLLYAIGLEVGSTT